MWLIRSCASKDACIISQHFFSVLSNVDERNIWEIRKRRCRARLLSGIMFMNETGWTVCPKYGRPTRATFLCSSSNNEVAGSVSCETGFFPPTNSSFPLRAARVFRTGRPRRRRGNKVRPVARLLIASYAAWYRCGCICGMLELFARPWTWTARSKPGRRVASSLAKSE